MAEAAKTTRSISLYFEKKAPAGTNTGPGEEPMDWAPAPDTQIGGDVVPTATTNTASVPVIIIDDDDSPAKSVAMDTASVSVGSGSRTDVIMIDDADVNEGLRADTDTEPGAE